MAIKLKSKITISSGVKRSGYREEAALTKIEHYATNPHQQSAGSSAAVTANWGTRNSIPFWRYGCHSHSDSGDVVEFSYPSVELWTTVCNGTARSLRLSVGSVFAVHTAAAAQHV